MLRTKDTFHSVNTHIKLIMEPEQKKVTRSLLRWLELLIYHRECANVDLEEALDLKHVDHDEQYCHVQFPGDLKDEHDCNVPRVWWIKDWRTSVEKWARDKERSAIERKLSNIRSERIDAIVKAAHNGMLSVVPLENLRAMAVKAVEERNQELASLFNINLADWDNI